MKNDTQVFDTLAPIKYDTNLAAIAKLREQYMPLEITDLEDEAQFKTVHDARMVMVRVRTTIDKQRVAQKAKALQYGRDVDSAAKALLAESDPVEAHLQAEEDKVLNEQKRIKEEKYRIEREKIQKRVDDLQQYGVVKPFDEVATCSDGEFAGMLAAARGLFEAEKKAKAEEEARRVAERAELDRKAAEQAIKDKEVADKEEALRAEREAFEKEKREAQEKKDREEFEKQAEKKALQDAQDAIARKAKEDEEKEEADKAEKLRQEKLRPDCEKLIAWVRIFNSETIPAPRLVSEEAKQIFGNAIAAIEVILQRVEEQAEEM